jgi:L-asparaginase/Glu-tRNA(Gln) amidotransferase subunit D
VRDRIKYIMEKYFLSNVYSGLMDMDQYFQEDTSYRPFGSKPKNSSKYFEDLASRYILGIVVLHGTDTMAYSSASAMFGLAHVPCSIVFTGANRSLDERDEETTILPLDQRLSDGWTNIIRSIHFLRVLGHKLSECFVCFGDSVHLALNVQKHITEGVAASFDTKREEVYEPHNYRNRCIFQQYAFKFIDDIICNNLYPTDGYGRKLLWSDLVPKAGLSHNKLRHVRPKLFPKSADGPIRRGIFSRQVQTIKIYPEMPMIVFDKSIRVLLVEGYEAGTFPSEPPHTFVRICRKAIQIGIPVVHVCRSGNLPGDEYFRGLGVNKLLGIVPESAYALLSVLTSSIENDVWSPPGVHGPDLQKYRWELLHDRIKSAPGREGSAMSVIMGSVNAETGALRAKVLTEMAEQGKSNERLANQELLQSSANLSVSLKRFVNDASREVGIISHRHEVYEYLRGLQPYSKAGYAPDRWADTFDFGFRIGWSVGDEVFTESGNRFPNGLQGGNWPELSKLLAAGLSKACKVCTVHGSVSVDHIRLDLSESDFKYRWYAEWTRGEAFNNLEASSVTHISPDERIWWADLSRERPWLTRVEVDRLDSRRYNFLKDAWRSKVTPIDWMILGFVKGLAVKSLRVLRPDGLLGADLEHVDAMDFDRDIGRLAVVTESLQKGVSNFACSFMYQAEGTDSG